MEKALFTIAEDFRQNAGAGGMLLNPLYYHNMQQPSSSPFTNISGTPQVVEGVRGDGLRFNNNSFVHTDNITWNDVDQFMISCFIAPTQADLDGFRIIATTRGWGMSNYGFHLALYNARIDMRLYGGGGQIVEYSPGTASRRVQAGQIYHLAFIYRKGATIPCQVRVNGEVWVSSGIDPNVNPFTRRMTIGDMPSSGGGTSVNGFHGTIDEVIIANGIVPTNEDIEQYRLGILSGSYLDDYTEAGTLRLGKDQNGNYVSNSNIHRWTSAVVDLDEEAFDDYGRIHAVGSTPDGTSLTFQTRTSEDGATWNSWQQIASNGRIYSPNLRYIQVRVIFTTNNAAQTPVLEEIQIFDVARERQFTLITSSDEPLVLYKDKEDELVSMGEVKNAYDIIIEEEVNGEEIISFKLPINDPKRKEIGDEPVEMLAYLGDRRYIIKEVVDKRDGNGKLFTIFKGEALWYEPHDYYVKDFEIVEVNAETALNAMMEHIHYEEGDTRIDWEIGEVEISGRRRTIRSEWSSVLAVVRDIQSTYGGEVEFDVLNKKINLRERIGEDKGIRFYYNKNLKEVERTIDTYDLKTRIYPKGKGDLDITTVNNGVPYLENREWVDKLKLRRKVIPHQWKDDRYTVPQNLKEDGQRLLDQLSKPRIAYVVQVKDLSSLSGHKHEAFTMGDTVTVIDKDLFGEELPQRVIRRKWNVREPQNTEVELAEPQRTLAEITSRAIDDRIQTLIESDPLDVNDVQQMTVFNHLLNSRADEGINEDWIVEAGTGFEVANEGLSGSWSFKTRTNFGEHNVIKQTVEGVSHRSTYTVSAAVATDGRITRGSSNDAFVGIKVVVHYEDGTSEDFLLAIPDITDEGNDGGE